MTPTRESSRTPGHVTPEVDRAIKDILGITPLLGRIAAVNAAHESGNKRLLPATLLDLASGLLYQVEILTASIEDTVSKNPELASRILVAKLRDAHDQVNTTADHEEPLRAESTTLNSLTRSLAEHRRKLVEALPRTSRRRELAEVISVTAAREPTSKELEILASAALSLALSAHEIGAYAVATSSPLPKSKFRSDLRAQFARSAERMSPMVVEVHRLLPEDQSISLDDALGRGKVRDREFDITRRREIRETR